MLLVSGLIPGTQTCYNDRIIVVFVLKSLQANSWTVPHVTPATLPLHPSEFILHSSFFMLQFDTFLSLPRFFSFHPCSSFLGFAAVQAGEITAKQSCRVELQIVVSTVTVSVSIL